ncbi:hypothetical protein ACFQ78_11090 [Streptomyces sp. NPDC056519]|uniref:hypothetical protein n=1 Tax=Streptomyces sp. NPDC056519 TaxID=3345849 RepID=UPI003696DCC5
MENDFPVTGALSPSRSLDFERLDAPAAEQDAWAKTFCVFCMGTCMQVKTDAPARRKGRRP